MRKGDGKERKEGKKGRKKVGKKREGAQQSNERKKERNGQMQKLKEINTG